MSVPVNVLLVEDDDNLRELYVKALERFEFKAFAFGDGASALEFLRSNGSDVHVLLTDVMMPTMGGLELFGLAKKFRPELRILCMSGYSDESFEEVQNSSIPFLEKPFCTDELIKKIREIMSA